MNSKINVGDSCIIDLHGSGIIKDCTVSAVKFTDYGKVLYDIKVLIYFGEDSQPTHHETIFKDVDSYFVKNDVQLLNK